MVGDRAAVSPLLMARYFIVLFFYGALPSVIEVTGVTDSYTYVVHM